MNPDQIRAALEQRMSTDRVLLRRQRALHHSSPRVLAARLDADPQYQDRLAQLCAAADAEMNAVNP